MVVAMVTAALGTLIPVGKLSAAHAAPLTVTLGSASANTVTTYTIVLSDSGAIAVGGTISIRFPTGTTVPATIANTSVSVNGIAPSSNPVVNGLTVTVTYSTAGSGAPAIADGAAATVVFSAGAGITNPRTPATTYVVNVSTGTDAVEVASTAYTITTSAVSTPSTGAIQGGTLTITGTGFTASGTVNVTAGPATGSAAVGTDGNFSMTATRTNAAAGALTITDGAGRTATTAAVPLLPDLTIISGATARPQQTVTIDGRNFTGAGTVAAGGIYFGQPITGTAIAAGNVVSGAGALTDRDGDTTLDDFRITIRVPSNTASGTYTVNMTDGTLTGSATVTVNGAAVTITPASGVAGTLVTATATNFPASNSNAANAITIDNPAGAITPNTTFTTDTSGGYTTSLTISSTAPAGARTLTFSVTATGGDAAVTTTTAIFTVTAPAGAIVISPNSGPRGTQFSVTGTGFPASLAAGGLTATGGAITPGGGALTTDSAGVLSGSTQTIGAGAAYGANTITVTATVAARSGSSSFTVTQPTVSISPATGTVGTALTITGSGWLANGVVFVTLGGTTVQAVQANSAGALTGSFTIPSTSFAAGAAATLVFGANDGTGVGNTAQSTNFALTAATFTVSPASVAVGGTVTVSGTGFLPFSGVSALTIGGASVLPTTPIVTDATGAFSTTFVTPGLSGIQIVSATVGAVTRTQNITISSSTGGVGVPVATATALAAFPTGRLQIANVANAAGTAFTAFVPGLPGNAVTQIQPNSVIILTVNADTTVIVSGVSFALTANTPRFIPVGNNVTITIQ